MFRRPCSFRAMLARRLVVSGLVLVVLSLAALLARDEAITVEPAQPSPAEILADIHGCWSGEAPADMRGQIPGHVVMILPDGRTVYSTDVGRAMRHLFETPERGLTVFAFCR